MHSILLVLLFAYASTTQGWMLSSGGCLISTRRRGLWTLSSSVTWKPEFSTSASSRTSPSRNVSRADAIDLSGSTRRPSTTATSFSVPEANLVDGAPPTAKASSSNAREEEPQPTTPDVVSSSITPTFASPITTFASFSEYLTTLDCCQEEDLVVVLYAASFCKLCQRATMVYKQLASKFLLTSTTPPADRGGGRRPTMRFHRLEVEPHDALARLKPLGIDKFPFVQIFRGGDCVASFSTGPSHLFRKKVDDTLQKCAARTPEEWHEVQRAFESEIRENRRVRRALHTTGQTEEQKPPTAPPVTTPLLP